MVSEEAIEAFRTTLRGRLIEPENEDYDEARTVYNGMIDKRPLLIVRCAGVADVIAAVNLARDHDLPLAVRGGGHSVAGNSTCDGGMVIDLSQMNAVRVDPHNQTARAEAGATWRDFDHETQAFGLATTGGIASSTGIAGLTLGGGIGYLNRKHGLACDNLISADIVTADGQFRTASAHEHPDLFWALRGGGGNFGVVTTLEYRVHPLGPILGGMLVWPFDRARDVLRYYRDFSTTAPDELRLDAIITTSPLGPSLVLVVCWSGAIEEGARVLQALRKLGPPVVDTIAPISYATIQTLLESLGYTPGLHHYWKGGFFSDFSDDAIDCMLGNFLPAPGPLCGVAIEHLGGAISRVAATDTAFSHRHAQHSLLVAGVVADRGAVEQMVPWTRHLWSAMQPFLDAGVYVNYLSDGESQTTIHSAYGVNYQRLADIKRKYDPTNLFRLNQNILPSTGSS
jgi:FAD/FMN-containing dehydrogenase